MVRTISIIAIVCCRIGGYIRKNLNHYNKKVENYRLDLSGFALEAAGSPVQIYRSTGTITAGVRN